MFSFQSTNCPYRACLSIMDSGDKGIRTLDPLRARQVLSQLSYTPIGIIYLLNSNIYYILFKVGPSGLEPPTSRLSGVRSNHLSYEPI